MLSVLIGVLIICVVGAICFWVIEKFVNDGRLANLLKLLVVLIFVERSCSGCCHWRALIGSSRHKSQHSLSGHRRARRRHRGLRLSALPGAAEDHRHRDQRRQKRNFHREEVVRDFPDGALDKARPPGKCRSGGLDQREHRH